VHLKIHVVVAALAATIAFAPLGGFAQQSGSTYKIGMTVPQTGPLAGNSEQFITAAQIGIDDVNRAGGVKGRKLQLVIEDSQGTPQAGIAAMRKLVQVDGVAAIISFYTNIVTAQIPLGDELKIPTMSPVETPNLVSKGVYSFAHSPTLALSGPLLERYWKAAGYKKIFAILGDNGFGRSIAPLVKPYITAAGAESNEAFINLAETDFRGVLARVKEYNPNAIYISAQGSAAETAAIKQLRELGVTVPIFNGSNFYESKQYHEAIGPYSEGMFFVGFALDKNVSKKFVDTYRAKMNADPGAQQGELYDMIKILAFAIDRGGYTGEGIRNQIAALKGEVPSLMGGTITMGTDHYSQTAGIGLWQVQKGREVKVTTPGAK
jgi:branched-chain amino acid transport system substrate-binding protein